MRKWHLPVYHVLLFVLAQITWLLLLGLWIYWYVSNYVIFHQESGRITPKLSMEGYGSLALVGGLILLAVITVLMTLTFRYLYGQVALHRLYGSFIANVTHELKSPLAAIQLHLETVALREMPVVQQRAFFSLLLDDVGRLNALIDTILKISKLEKSRSSYLYDVHAMDPLAYALANEARETFRLPYAAIRLTGAANCVCVLDRVAMQTVFNNLVDNSIKYSLGPVQITLQISNTGKRAVLEYTDHGVGIRATDLKLIFRKFFRVLGRQMPSVKGVGLGLYRVREILEAHGGSVDVRSKGVNQGATFRMELPIFRVSKKRFTKKLLLDSKARRMEDDNDGK